MRRAEELLEKAFKDLDPVIADALWKAIEGRELSPKDAYELFKVKDAELLALILVANEVRRRSVGDVVTYVVNRNINFTNVCTVRCSFCAFSRSMNDPEAYLLSIEEVAKKAEEAWRLGATEVCIQGGIHPDIDADFYAAICREVKKSAPGIHIHAFSPMEVVYGAEKSGLSIEEHLKMLKEAGLDSLPGTAAEILDDEVRKNLCPLKISVNTWIKVIKTAHRLGIPTTCTIMYGHIDKLEQRVNHLKLLRDVQRETSGFTEFVPLTFVHANAPIYLKGKSRAGATGIEDVKMYAVSRLMLNGYINNIQVSWVKLGVKLAQFCLNAGANDFGGTLMEENISRAAGAMSGQYLPPEEIRRIIKDAGRIPAQRDTLYNIIRTW